MVLEDAPIMQPGYGQLRVKAARSLISATPKTGTTPTSGAIHRMRDFRSLDMDVWR